MSAKTRPASEASEPGRRPIRARRKTAPTASRIRPGQERARAAAARRTPARRVSSGTAAVGGAVGGADAGRRRRKKRKRDFRFRGGAFRSGWSGEMCRAGRQGRGGKAAPDRLASHRNRFDPSFDPGSIHRSIRVRSLPVSVAGCRFGVSSLQSSLRWVRRGIGRSCDPLPASGISSDPPAPVGGTVSRSGGSGPTDSRVLSRGVGRSGRASSAAAAGRAGVPGPEVQEVRSAPVGFKRPGRNRPKTRNFGPGNARRAGDPGRNAGPECAPMVAARRKSESRRFLRSFGDTPIRVEVPGRSRGESAVRPRSGAGSVFRADGPRPGSPARPPLPVFSPGHALVSIRLRELR